MIILRFAEVAARTGLSRTTIYAAIKENTFPRQIKLGKRASGWVEEEIESWIEQKINAREISK